MGVARFVGTIALAHQWPDIFPTPPEVFGFESRFVHVALGVSLHVVDRLGAEPTLAPVVLLHGWPDSWRSFQRLLPLIGAQRRIIALDHRGFVLSSKPVDSLYDIPMFADDLKAVLRSLGVSKIGCLVGHSMGSFVAWDFAGRWPERVERLVLIGTAPVARNPITDDLMNQVGALSEVTYAFTKRFQDGTFFNASSAGDWYEQTVVHESMLVPLRVWKKAFEGMLQVTEARAQALLPRITAATMLVRGVADGLFSHAAQNEMLLLLRHVHSVTLHEVDRAGHSVQWEAHGARTVAHLLCGADGFLAARHEEDKGGVPRGAPAYGGRTTESYGHADGLITLFS